MILVVLHTTLPSHTIIFVGPRTSLLADSSQLKIWLPRGKLKSAWCFAVLLSPPSSSTRRFCMSYSMREAFKNEKSTTSRRYLREKPRKRSQIVCVPYIQVMSQFESFYISCFLYPKNAISKTKNIDQQNPDNATNTK